MSDGIGLAEALLGLDGFRVLTVREQAIRVYLSQSVIDLGKIMLVRCVEQRRY